MPIEITGWFMTTDSAEHARKSLAKWSGVRSAVVYIEALPRDPTSLGSFSFNEYAESNDYNGLIGIYAGNFNYDGSSSANVRLTVNADTDVGEGVLQFMLDHGATSAENSTD